MLAVVPEFQIEKSRWSSEMYTLAMQRVDSLLLESHRTFGGC